jgi:hypothetical protein
MFLLFTQKGDTRRVVVFRRRRGGRSVAKRDTVRTNRTTGEVSEKGHEGTAIKMRRRECGRGVSEIDAV